MYSDSWTVMKFLKLRRSRVWLDSYYKKEGEEEKEVEEEGEEEKKKKKN